MRYTKNVLGLFALEDKEVVEYMRFSEDPEEIARALEEVTEREKEFLEDLEESESIDKVQKDVLEVAESAGIDKERSEIRELQWKVARQFTRNRLKSKEERDKLLMQAVRALSEIDESKHSMIERLRSWYSLYFPELEEEIDSHDRFAQLVSEKFDRKETADLEEVEENSTGIALEESDKEVLQDFGRKLKETQEFRNRLKSYIERLAGEIAPNLSTVLGELLTARMISEAGSLEKLAKMPSSTVQVLGAEKALFRHMKGKGSAPKHGLLFMHSKVNSVPEDKRGKMARFIANKSSIAARLDHFGGEFKGEKLEEEIEEKYREVVEG
ncbi:MAG: hypothetical protein SVV03_00915 [Candidatus Nanohaloarchaea archaeon]|nr:hypothetical protein [Candidatus Nanohaloarchaea archaeon]